jgi:hypothetical protein
MGLSPSDFHLYRGHAFRRADESCLKIGLQPLWTCAQRLKPA